MKQPSKRTVTPRTKKPTTVKKKDRGVLPRHKIKKKRKHPKYGTSKLEERFANEFLNKLGLEYVYQFEARSIGRYFDFRIEPDGPIIEIQGSYWHGDKRLYEEKDLNHIQKKNMWVDEIKKKWCDRNGIPLIYIWEKDINGDPEGVLNFLRRTLANYINYKSQRGRLKPQIIQENTEEDAD